jgi:hypothetical protein
MAPRTTRLRSNAPATRKRGESDPNKPPKKSKTRHTEEASEDEHMEEEDIDLDPQEPVVKPAKRGKKGR